MGNSAASACLPGIASRVLGIPTEEEIIRAKFMAAQQKLNEGISLLGARGNYIDRHILYLEDDIRQRHARGDKSGALAVFRSKKAHEKSRDKNRQTLTRVETQLETLVESQYNGELLKVLEECSNVMDHKLKTMSVEDVEDTMDKLNESHLKTQEIGQALSRPVEDEEDEEDTGEDDLIVMVDGNAVVIPGGRKEEDGHSPSDPTKAESVLDRELKEFLEATTSDPITKARIS